VIAELGSPSDWLRVALFEFFYVLLPGSVTYAALRRGDSRGRWLTVGVPIGFSLCAIAFVASKLTGTWRLFQLYPFGFIVLAGFLMARGNPKLERDRSIGLRKSAGRACALAGLLAAVMALLYVEAYVRFPLPSVRPALVDCRQDMVYWVSLTAEIKHHWPPMQPWISGEPVSYHYFAYAHMAALSYLTGLSVEHVVLRFAVIPIMTLLTLQLVYLGYCVGGSFAVGLVTAGIPLLLRDPIPHRVSLAGGASLFANLIESPSFLLGAVFMLAILIEVSAGPGGDSRWSDRKVAFDLNVRRMIVFGLLFLGAAGAKGSVAPAIVVAAAATGALVWVRDRRIRWNGWIALAVVGLAVALSVGTTLYREAVGELVVAPFHIVFGMPLYRGAVKLAGNVLSPAGIAWHVVSAIGAGIVLVVLFINYIVGAGLSFRKVSIVAPTAAFFLIGSVVNVLPGLLLGQVGGSEVYFLLQAMLFLAPLASLGIIRTLYPFRWSALNGSVLLIVALSGVATLTQAVHEGRAGAAGPVPSMILDKGLYQGLRWLRSSTPDDAVILSNLSTVNGSCYSAISERRQVLEMVKFSPQWQAFAMRGDRTKFGPYEDRRRVVEAAFETGDAARLEGLRTRYGATYVLIDKLNQRQPPKLATSLTHVFGNASVDIYRIGDG
jgi:hypothetical protein